MQLPVETRPVTWRETRLASVATHVKRRFLPTRAMGVKGCRRPIDWDAILTRKHGTEVFAIKNQRHVEYWRVRKYPVMLVVRTSDGRIRWMDVRAYLQREHDAGREIKQIVFHGEPFTAAAVRALRDRVLGNVTPEPIKLEPRAEAGPIHDKSEFDVFLSHNSKDKPMVRQLGEALRQRGLTVWLDEWELVPGRPWQEALEKIIRTTKSAAVLVGKDGLGPWEEPEMRACLGQFVKRKLPVIPVLLPDAPQQPELPLFLQAFTWVDLRSGLTNEGLSRLEWGITGRKPSPKIA